ncbi:transporter substrate-binding domain-containing protein [Rhodococcus hoagii]|jgi:glutamate transport system substrate-binding protein|uniref:ABC transporter, substrate-binding protein, family 3 n=3 Tax=Rhodococcus hoagii TaxID=43767 RepID=E9SVE2_RHOHA|nr:glutamate ABC transporter substrate-binding protein [Prescottella equi]MBU4614507.1 glutamate ABC transporter substrate-binding protein [Rhodococcus sp. GG48]MCD7052010.1 glutamate ABC transporter substrate-binding protein [Rhodococcus sp. BH2-1]GBF14965.1 ABC transporter glutamine-binding protein GlnH precursor [Rhodococcus sp. Br-6]AVP68402.1 glutamate-binding protein [Prescottella equi]EGD26276.1 ABC transporter, substrate-binding protein, family 3 [Prescottella equi ATCC 33707]
MKRIRIRAPRALALVAAVTAVVLTASACGSSEPRDVLADAAEGQLTIGTKYDQPGLALREPDKTMTGFDVEVAKYIANYLGVPESGITWREAPSAQRENLIKNGEVDFVVGTYSITDNRKKVIDFAGPYYVAGQSLLVRADDDSITGAESLQGGKKLCSVSGSTPAQKIAKSYPGVQLQQFDSYSSCVEALHRGKVDALTTDDIILAGYAAQYPGEFKLAGQPFTTELYGVGLPKGETEARMKINDAIEDMIATGAWQRALEETMGDSGYALPAPPSVDRY